MVGMIVLSLENITDTYIALFSTKQNVRITPTLKKIHSFALKRILQYFQDINDKGIIMAPNFRLTMDFVSSNVGCKTTNRNNIFNNGNIIH